MHCSQHAMAINSQFIKRLEQGQIQNVVSRTTFFIHKVLNQKGEIRKAIKIRSVLSLIHYQTVMNQTLLIKSKCEANIQLRCWIVEPVK